jgi:hypothetical protein
MLLEILVAEDSPRRHRTSRDAVQNASSIMTQSLLSIHVNPGFMEGRLHTEGGIPFFLVALVHALSVTMMLIRSERRKLPTPASL